MDLEFDPKEILLVFGANVRRSREMQRIGISELAT